MASLNELLDLVRGGQQLPEEDKVDIDIRESVTGILKELEGKAAERSIRLEFSMDTAGVVFRGDVQDLERIFLNLVGNAVKYSPNGGAVRMIGAMQKDNLFAFRICDEGIGIPADEQSRIFDEFYRASNAKREHRTGTGLGLSIVKKTVEKYGGRIEVESELGRGSCFTVVLPVITLQ